MRCLHFALTLFAVPVVAFCLAAAAGPPDYSGTWQLDAAKSPEAAGRAVTLTIQEDSGKINFTRTARERDGREVTSRFSCQPGGTTCEFDEGGHKAKVSLWYDGTALVILKTDGPKEDSVTQWKLQLGPDKNSLTVDLTHIEPNDKTENLVFDKRRS